MSDQPSQKPSADASKSFAIPSRPALNHVERPRVSSWKRGDHPREEEPVRLSPVSLSDQPTEPMPRLSERPATQPTAPAPHLSEPTRAQSGQTATGTLERPVSRPLEAPPELLARYSEPPYRQAVLLPPPVLASAGKKRGGRRVLYIALAALAILVTLGGLLNQQLAQSGDGGYTRSQNSALLFSGSGPFAHVPLSAQQISAIQHLAGHMKYKALASLYVSHMSLNDEIGQLIMVEYNDKSYSNDLDYMINTLHVGGVIMYEFQMTSATQTKNDIAHMQQRANLPLLISTDEEGGPYVHRLSNIYGYRMSATQIEQSGSLNVAKQQGLKTSRDLAALGINEDLAPDVDVNQVNGYDMVTRTFGNTPAEVIKYAGAYLQAMQSNGTIACIKHFPGLGGALTDAHKGLPVVHSTKQQVYDIDLAPFKTFIQSPNALLNPGMIMPTDMLLPSIDAKYPAELSYTFMTQILRNEFGYDGVSLTDALYMQGITNTWDMYTASVMALQAGNDMLLGANGTSQTLGVINAIKQALKDGRLTKARIDESVARILALKMQYHLMQTPAI